MFAAARKKRALATVSATLASLARLRHNRGYAFSVVPRGVTEYLFQSQNRHVFDSSTGVNTRKSAQNM